MLLLLTACATEPAFHGGGAENDRRIMVMPDVYGAAMNTHHESVTIFGRNFNSRLEIPVPGAPVAHAWADEVLFVTLGDVGSIARIEDFELTDVTWVGTEPSGIVADGDRLIVALTTENAVVELDLDTLEELARYTLDRPVDLAIHPSGNPVYATTPTSVQIIDRDEGEVSELPWPELELQTPLGTTVPALPRPSGRPDVDWDRLVVPTFAVDIETPEGTLPRGTGAWSTTPTVDIEEGPGRFAGALVEFDVDGREPPIAHHIGVSAPGDVLLQGDQAWVPIPTNDRVVRIGLESAQPITQGFHRSSMMIRTGYAGPIAVWPEGQVHESHTDTLYRGDRAIPLTEEPLDATLALGRRLFSTGADARVSAPGSGVSCSSCHMDGGSDGLVWPLREGDRQTPSLEGRISDTEPVTWTSQVETVAHEADKATTERMGGTGLTSAELDAIAAWIDHIRPRDMPEVDAEARERGEQIFYRLGCATCHVPPTYGGGGSYSMFGEASVDTPALLGVGATAPYLHDGSAETLEDVVRMSTEGGMATTAGLSDDEIADLVTFLASLEESR